MEKKEYRYEIAGKTYVQRPLVLGQTGQVVGLLKGISIPSNIDALEMASLLGEKLPEAIAIALTEDGTGLKDKNIDELTDIFRGSVDIETAAEIIDNFFVLNPIASILERLTGMMRQMVAVKKTMKTGSNKPSSSLPEET